MTIGWLFLWSLRQNARSAVLPSCPPSLGRGIWDSWPDEPRPTSKCVAKLIETKPADVDFARAPPRFYMDLYFVPATRALGLRYASCALPWWLISKNIQAIIRSAPVVSEKNGTRRQLIQELAKHPGRRWNGFPFRACARAPAEAKLFAVYVTVVVRVCSSVQSQSRIDVWYHRSVCSLAWAPNDQGKRQKGAFNKKSWLRPGHVGQFKTFVSWSWRKHFQGTSQFRGHCISEMHIAPTSLAPEDAERFEQLRNVPWLISISKERSWFSGIGPQPARATGPPKAITIYVAVFWYVQLCWQCG